MHLILAVICLLLGEKLYAGQSRVESVAVKTRAPSNKVVTFWYRVPSSYQEDPTGSFLLSGRSQTHLSGSCNFRRTQQPGQGGSLRQTRLAEMGG